MEQSVKVQVLLSAPFILLVLDGIEDAPYKRAHVVRPNGGRTNIGVSPSGKAQDFDSCIRWFKSIYPSQKNRRIAWIEAADNT